MKNLLLLLQALLLSSCFHSTKYYINENNDTIASFKYYDEEYNERWKVIVKDSLVTDEEIHNLFWEIGLYSILKEEVDKSDYSMSNKFYLYMYKNRFSSIDDYVLDYYLVGRLSKHALKTNYEYTLESKEEYETESRKRSEEAWKSMDEYLEKKKQGKDYYYGEDMLPVINFLENELGVYKPISSSDIKMKGEYYTVRHIYKTQNAFGAMIKCDKLFFINKYGEIVKVIDYKEKKNYVGDIQ